MAAKKQEPTLKDLQRHIAQVCAEKGWDNNSITEIFLLFSEEVGELAKAIRKETAFKGEKRSANRDNLEEEFADVLNYLMDLANQFNVDLSKAYYKKHNINARRIWE